jgi:allose kinase
MYTLGIDIGGTNLRIGLVDQKYNLSCFEKHSARELGTADACVALAAIIKQYLASHNAENLTRGICIGFPATVDKKGERVLGAPNLGGFDGVNVKEELSRYLSYPIFIELELQNLS